MNVSSNNDEKWVNKGLITAYECFSCTNKINHKFKDNRITILCKDPCNYTPKKEELRPHFEKIPEIEQ